MSVLEQISSLCDCERMRAYHPELFVQFIINEYSSVGFERTDVVGKQVIDLGANVGMFSALCHGVGAKEILAVEFNPETFAILKENVSKMHVKCINKAVHGRSWQNVYVEGTDVSAKASMVGEHAVETISLDDVVRASVFVGDDLVLKMDIEGSEYDALIMAPGPVIQRFGTIYLETHVPDRKEPGRKSNFLKDYLSFLGFEIKNSSPMFNWQWVDGKVVSCTVIEDFDMLRLKRKN